MASKYPKISVIIVSWNVADSLERCLASVFATEYPQLEVMVVDNASSDNSAAIPRKFPGVSLIEQPNIGFPKAVNLGFAAGTGDYYLILNPDTRLPSDFFTKILHTAQEFPTTGVMGPKLVNPDGSAQGSVFPEPSIFKAIQEFWLGLGPRTQKYIPPGLTPVPVNSISGSCMFIPAPIVKKIGRFTDQVFMYYEDLDFCRRVRQAGLQVIFDPRISIIHEHGSSSQKSPAAGRYLADSSRWYNGWLKYYLLTLIIKASRIKQVTGRL